MYDTEPKIYSEVLKDNNNPNFDSLVTSFADYDKLSLIVSFKTLTGGTGEDIVLNANKGQ